MTDWFTQGLINTGNNLVDFGTGLWNPIENVGVSIYGLATGQQVDLKPEIVGDAIGATGYAMTRGGDTAAYEQLGSDIAAKPFYYAGNIASEILTSLVAGFAVKSAVTGTRVAASAIKSSLMHGDDAAALAIKSGNMVDPNAVLKAASPLDSLLKPAATTTQKTSIFDLFKTATLKIAPKTAVSAADNATLITARTGPSLFGFADDAVKTGNRLATTAAKTSDDAAKLAGRATTTAGKTGSTAGKTASKIVSTGGAVAGVGAAALPTIFSGITGLILLVGGAIAASQDGK